MTLTLLLDLDDTLLTTDIDLFQGVYLKALGKHLAQRVDPKALISQLLISTQAMVENNRPDRTLEQVFNASFYPALGLSRSEVQADIDRFYADVFPSLRPWTRPRPEAVKLIEQGFQRGYQVAIATNPLFPRTAILQRMEWAGLPVEKYPFRIVSSYETFHYTKPNPAYYAEVLAQMGWPDEPAIMIGNDLADDITPAIQFGIHTFHIKDDQNVLAQQTFPKAAGQSGSLLDCLSWLERADQTKFQSNFTQPVALTAILKSTPAALGTLYAPIPDSSLHQKPQPAEWSLTEIICHLRDVEMEVNLPRLRKIAEENNPFIPGQVTDPWAEERGYNRQDGQAALKDFIRARIETLEILQSFQSEDWERKVRHAIFGPTRVRELVGFMTTHDRTHVHQVVQTFEASRQIA